MQNGRIKLKPKTLGKRAKIVIKMPMRLLYQFIEERLEEIEADKLNAILPVKPVDKDYDFTGRLIEETCNVLDRFLRNR